MVLLLISSWLISFALSLEYVKEYVWFNGFHIFGKVFSWLNNLEIP